MSRRSCNPAVGAGLVAATLGTVPVQAQAFELPGTKMGASSEFLFAFLFGCAAGVTATFVARVISKDAAESREDMRAERVARLRDQREEQIDLNAPETDSVPEPEVIPEPELSAQPEPIPTPKRSFRRPFAPAPRQITESTKPFTPEQFAQAAAESKARADRRSAGPAHMAASRELRYKVARKHAAQAGAQKMATSIYEVPAVAKQLPQEGIDPWSESRMASADELSHGLFVLPDTTARDAMEDRRARHLKSSGSAEDVIFATVGATPDEWDLESSAPMATYYSTLYTEPLTRAEALRPSAPQRATGRHVRSSSVPKRPDDTASREAYRVYSETYQSQMGSEYEQVATEYALQKRRKFSAVERLRGVAAILQDRLGTSMMDGIPVIPRADGTVADVGTSWWNDTVGNLVVTPDTDTSSVPSVLDLGTETLAKRAASIAARISMLDQEAAANQQGSDSTDEMRRRSELIGTLPPQDRAFFSRVEGEGPKRSVSSRAGQSDASASQTREQAWAVALEELGGEPFVFKRKAKVVTETKVDAFTAAAEQARTAAIQAAAAKALEASELDEPDGLEGTTNIIPFKTVGNHPEVVDASSYVDYLIEDEFAKSTHAVARERVEDGSVKASLRVMKGGTGGWKSSDVAEAAAEEEEFVWLEAREA